MAEDTRGRARRADDDPAAEREHVTERVAAGVSAPESGEKKDPKGLTAPGGDARAEDKGSGDE